MVDVDAAFAVFDDVVAAAAFVDVVGDFITPAVVVFAVPANVGVVVLASVFASESLKNVSPSYFRSGCKQSMEKTSCMDPIYHFQSSMRGTLDAT